MSNAFITSEVRHAFTGHEDLGELGLIHMNGRLYDPAIGRFLSADPTIQYADDMQNYNRYSYINNNPLSAGDPSGYGFLSSIFKGFKKLIKHAISKIKTAVIFAAGTIACSGNPACGAALVGAVNGAQNGGGLLGALKGAVAGYVSQNYGPYSMQAFAVNTAMNCVNGGGSRCVRESMKQQMIAELKQTAINLLPLPKPGPSTCQNFVSGGCGGGDNQAGSAVGHIYQIIIPVGIGVAEAVEGTVFAANLYKAWKIGSRLLGIANAAENAGEEASDAPTTTDVAGATGGGAMPPDNNDEDESNPKIRDDNWFKKQGIDAHDVKKDLGGSRRNLAVDKNGRVYTVDRIGSGNKQYVDTLENLKNQSPYKKP